MSKFNDKLKTKLSKKKPEEGFMKAQKIVPPDTTNRQGHDANRLSPFLRLVSMLNTLKLDDQFYRTENQTLTELKHLIDAGAKYDPYLVAQTIVYSRCVGEGMRSINHAAAVFLAPYISGKEWAKRFYSKWDKKNQRGGTIFRTDDMSEIMACYKTFSDKALPNAMKKGFASVIEGLDLYNFGKYTKQIRDIANMVHPDPKQTLRLDPHNNAKELVYALDYIMQGNNIPAHTWENAQSDAGQIVAKAVKEGKLSKTEAETILQEAKAENWAQLLSEGRLGILAALRNLRNIILSNPNNETITNLCKLLVSPEIIRKGKIMPYQIDMANEVMISEFNSSISRQISQALLVAYEVSLPNLKELLQGNNLVMVDMSGSMWMGNGIIKDPARQRTYKTFAGDKAATIAATIAKATNADVIRFGGRAEYVNYNTNSDVFTIGKSMITNMGSTSLASAWELAAKSGRKYDRVFILSDYECNRGNTYAAYKSYVEKCGDPYVYQIDLAAYGTQQQVGPKVQYYYGFGYSMFDDISKSEFNPFYHLDKVMTIQI